MRQTLFLLFFFLAVFDISAQVDRIELGIQTTRRGIVWFRDTLPKHKPNWRFSRDTNAVLWVDTTTALRYDWDYKNDRWRTKGAYKDSLPPLAQYYHTSDSVVIDNTTAWWIRDTFNILHKYDSTCQAWTPIGDWIYGDTVPSNIAATDSNGAAIYTRSLWQDSDDNVVHYWDGDSWESFDDGIYGDGSPGSGSDTLPPGGSNVTIPGPWQGLSFGINNSGGPVGSGPWWHAITINSEYCADDMFIDLFVHRSEQDSFKIQDFDCETFIKQYHRSLNLNAGDDLNIEADHAVKIFGDSVIVQTVPTVSQFPFILGQATALKRIQGTAPGQVLKWNGSAWALAADSIASGGNGEANVGANIGSGVGVYEGKVDTTLRFKSLTEGYGIDITSTATEINIKSDTTQIDPSTSNELQTISASGAGPTSYDIDLSIGGGSVTLEEGANIDLTRSGNTITIAATPSGGASVDGAENGLYVSGTKVRLGTNALIEPTAINQNGNRMDFYGGKWIYASSAVGGYTPSQDFAIVGSEAAPTNSTPTTDGILEIRPRSGSAMQGNSLTIGGYPTDATGMWMQSRSALAFNTYYPLLAQPRGGKFAVGRNNAPQAVVTFSAVGLTGSTASGRVLMLEHSEGNGITGMGFGTGADNLGAEITYQSSQNAIRITNRSTTNNASTVRIALGNETDDAVTFVRSAESTKVKSGFGVTAPASVHSTVQSAGSLATAFTQVSGTLTLNETHHTCVYTLSGTTSWTLPDPSTCAGRQYVIHHFGSSGQIGLNYNVVSSTGTTFNSVPSRAWAWIISDGANWRGYRVNSI